MRIAQVAPLAESVPPTHYGGTERVVSYLTEELVRKGHEVTLFASGDSQTSARLVSACPRALWRDEHLIPEVYQTIQMEQVRREAARFDVIHFHCDHWHLPLMRELSVPYLTTLHGRLDLPDLEPLYQTFPDTPLVSISDSQRMPFPDLNWVQTVYHGLPADLLKFREDPEDYVVFMGRTSPEKGLDKAIQIARSAGVRLRISAAVQPANREYFERVISPQLDHPLMEFVGELGGTEKEELLRGARALLFPIDWPEPFGLVMIEAMACGTPVIAFRRGSVPEVVADGLSGFVVDSVEDAVRALGRVETLSRQAVRRYFEDRFLVERMTADYLQAYERLIESASAGAGPGGAEVGSVWSQDGVPALQPDVMD